MSSDSIPPGRVGSLTLEEQKSLQKFWQRLLEITGVKEKDDTAESIASKAASLKDANDKYGQTQEFMDYLNDEKPENIRDTLWSAIKGDNPDSLLLRFLRARKWEVDKAVVMLVSTIKWRRERDVDNTICRGGEAVGLKDSPTEDDKGFMLQYSSGKSYVRGLDRDRRPVYIVKPALHNPKTQSPKVMEDYILHTIESIRNLVRDPFDTACLIFDMTGFGIRNMDFPAVQFIVQVFEARYPETLGVVAIHNAPWVFHGIWRIVKGWLDPVVATKFNFTKNASDLSRFIDPANLQTEYGGEDCWTYKYLEPQQGENDLMADEETRAKLQDDRDEVVREYEKATLAWSTAGDPASDEAAALDARRLELAGQLQAKYWKLDPYIRSRNFYDRTGILNDKGEVNFSPGT